MSWSDVNSPSGGVTVNIGWAATIIAGLMVVVMGMIWVLGGVIGRSRR